MNSTTDNSLSSDNQGDDIATRITHEIVQNRIDNASQLYMRHLKKLSINNKKSISVLVYDACDPEVIPFCFPDLHETQHNSPETDALLPSATGPPLPTKIEMSTNYNNSNDYAMDDKTPSTSLKKATSMASLSTIATIIVEMINQQNINDASELYQQNRSQLSNADIEMISTVLNQYSYDNSVIECLFPNLQNHDGLSQNANILSKTVEGDNDNDDMVLNHETYDATKRKLDDILKDESCKSYDHACFKMQWVDGKQQQRDKFYQQFISFCESDSLSNFSSYWGLSQPLFFKNPHALKGNRVYDRFMESIKLLPNDATLQVVFHGTSTMNIGPILQEGLDPKKRRGQAYGPGEYFGTNPSISVSYCKGGLSMLIFLVVVPDRSRNNKNEYYNNCPPEYVVVSTNEHQLPLGTLYFSACDPAQLEKSQNLKAQLATLSAEVGQKIRDAEMGMIRAKIIEEIIKENIHIASEKYQQHVRSLSLNDKREISMYLHKLYDAEVIGFYFENIPEPMTNEEHDLSLQNVDSMVSTAEEAVKRLNAERARLGIRPSRSVK